jgi:tetratricopeptide (TPR) repeat protein
MRTCLVIVGLALLLSGSGCGSDPENNAFGAVGAAWVNHQNKSVASKTHAAQSQGDLGAQAQDAQLRGDWATAAQLWEQAIKSENGFWTPELSRAPKRMAVYYYELGRSLGVLERYDEGEKDLLQALRLDEKFNGPKGMDFVELARLNHARGNNARAASFFDRFLPRLDETREKDTPAYIALLNEAAMVYHALGQNDRASELKAKAKKFSASHPNAKFSADYSWTPYKITPQNNN